MINVEIKLFGAFRKYEAQCAPLQLFVDEPATVKKIKSALEDKLGLHVANFCDAQLIEDSAIANDRRVLSSEETVTTSCVLSILPPVCGG